MSRLYVRFALLGLLPAVPLLHAAIAFSPLTAYYPRANPTAVAVADFNADGRRDLAVTVTGTNAVDILLGNGDGSFQAPVEYSVGSDRNPNSLALGDFNGDGFPDIVVGSVDSGGNGKVAMLAGNGDGTFRTAVEYATAGLIEALLAADFNADGKLDIAAVNSSTANVSVLVGNGDGTFRAAVNYNVQLGAKSLVGADFNIDGKVDLAVANSSSNTVSILFGNGDGTFQAAVSIATGAAPFSIVTGDFNRDGKADLATANHGAGTVGIFLGKGDGTFQWAANIAVGTAPYGLAMGDFNGDFNSDLAVTDNVLNSVFLVAGNGDGTFGGPVSFTAGTTPTLLAAADLNGDAKPDLAIVDSTSIGVMLVISTQTITFDNPGPRIFGSALSLTGTGSSGLAISYFSTTTGVCTVSGTTATLVTTGTCSLTALQPGNAFYSAATPVTQSFTVSTASQAISFPNPGTQTFGTAPALSATASSGLAVAFASSTPGVCSTTAFVSSGTCTIIASQAGNATFAAAPPVTQSFAVAAIAQSITFPNPGNQAVGTTPSLAASATSGFTVTFSSNTPSVCSPTVFVGIGICSITANQAGGSGYTAAAAATQSFFVTPNSQSITFANPGTQVFGAALVLAASANSNLAVAFASVTPAVCTTATFLQTGNCTIVATQPGNAGYAAAAPVTQSFSVAAGSQSIPFNNPGSQTVGTSLTLSARTSAGLPVTYAATSILICSTSGYTVVLFGVGTCSVTAIQFGNGNYAAATPVSQSFGVGIGSQTITFNNPGSQLLGTAPALTPSASSGLAVALASTTAGVCTVSGTLLNLLKIGSCTVVATQAGSGNYSAATAVSQTFNVTTGTQTISFLNPGTQNVATTVSLSAAASSGLTVAFATATPAICTVSGTAASLISPGTCTVTASQAGDANYAAAAAATQSFNVAAGAQTITFSNPGPQTVGGTVNLVAAASSGLPVNFVSLTASICSVSNSTATMLTAGMCTVSAVQVGNGSYASATPVNQNFNVAGHSQTITFSNPGGMIVGSSVGLNATASSGLGVIFNSTTLTVCTLSGSTVTAIATGGCGLRATQPGDSNYAAANPVNQSFNVSTGSQTITFTNPGPQAVGGTPVLSATASSGLPVSFGSGSPSICTTAALLGAGTCTITATQAGNVNFAAATPVTQSFSVTTATQTITFNNPGSQAFGTTPVLAAITSSGLNVGLASTTPSICTPTAFLTTGTCTVTASQAGNANYAAALPVSQSFSVTAAAQSIAFVNPGSQRFGTSPVFAATASSGLIVSLASTTPSICTPTAFLSIGTCNVTASQTGNTNYAAALPVSQSFFVTAAAQTVTFVNPGSQLLTGSFSLTATASSGLTVAFVSTTPSICSPTFLLTTGTCTITASQAGNANYAAAIPVSQSFSVTSATQTISFPNPGNQSFGTTPSFAATASSGLSVSFVSTTPSICTPNAFLGTGTCTIVANQSGNSGYTAASPVSQSFAVIPGMQTIAFNNPGGQAFGTTPTFTATASSGLTVAFATTTPTVCTPVAFPATGTCTITATQSGNANYAAANPVTQSFSISKATQTITFNNPGSQLLTGSLTLTAIASSGLTLAFASTTPSVCTTFALLTVGICTIAASQAGSANYLAATPVTQSFSITSASQTITFNNPGSLLLASPLILSATASSGLSVNFASNSPTVCTATALLITGTCTITASQAGNANYSAAIPVTQSFSVTTASQTITFNNPGTQTYGTTFSPVATATSGLPVTVSSATPTICTPTAPVTAGTCTINATQSGNGTFAAAAPVAQSFTINAANQTIAFNNPGAKTFGGLPLLTATATSGLTVTFAPTTPIICSTTTFLTIGTCTITASQSGNANYNAAAPVTQSFAVSAGSQTIAFADPGPQVYGAAFTLTASATSGLAVTLTSITPSICSATAALSVGTCSIAATQAGNANYSAAAPVTQAFNIGRANQSIDFPNPGAQSYAKSITLNASANSALGITFSSNTPSVCTVAGATLTFLISGSCTVTATQAGNANYVAATAATQTFAVTAPLLSATLAHIGNFTQGQAPANYTLTVSNAGTDDIASGAIFAANFTMPAGITVTVVSATGNWACTLTGCSLKIQSALTAGQTLPAIALAVRIDTNAPTTVTPQADITLNGVAAAVAIDPTTISGALTDTTPTDFFFNAVNLLREYGITGGCSISPPMFCPNDNVTRAQMAIFIVRSIVGGDTFAYSAVPHFNDVDAGTFGFKWIQKMYELSIAAGCGGGNYCPNDSVTRGQMAIFVIRARLGAASDPTFTYPGEAYFTDVPTTHPYFKWIQRMKLDGVTGGCGTALYCPDNPVTRGQMAIFLMRGAYNQLLAAGAPLLLSASPSSLAKGSTAAVAIAAANTGFVQGTTTITAGAGVTIGTVQVTGAGTLSVSLSVDSNAVPGKRTLVVTTGSEQAVLPNGLTIP